MSARRANGDGTAAAQRKDGTWYRTIVINGKRRYVYGRTEAEVNKKFRNLKEETPDAVARSVKSMTVEEYMMNWLTTYKKVELKPKSYDTLESTIRYQVVPFFRRQQFFFVTHDDVQKFINALDKKSCSYSIIRKAYLALNALYELKKLNGEFPYIFSHNSGKPMNLRNLNRAHDHILERAGISHIGIHALRHTFASQLFANKVDIKVISKLLGHSDVSVTYNIYIHLMQEDLPDATTTLDSILDAI